MSEIDIDRLGDVWRAQPDPAEIARVQRSADAVRRSARFGQLADFWLALVVSAVVLVLILSNPTPETGLVGGAAITLMLFSTMRQRRLRALELATLNAPTEHMIDQSILRAQTTVKRAGMSLVLTAPAMLLGIGFGAVLDKGSGSGLFARLTSNPGLVGLAAIMMATAVIAISLHFLRARSQARQELERLIQLRDAYEAEQAAE
ncbi:MAG: hypothetical protein AB7O91_02840 [Sphingomonas sp.]